MPIFNLPPTASWIAPTRGPGQHHQGVQQDPNAHNGGNPNLGHPSNYSALSNPNPYSTNSLQNGHSNTPSAGQGQVINEHWAKQLRLSKDAERAHIAMTDQHQPHYYARLKASENKGIGLPAPANGASGQADTEDMRRPMAMEKVVKRQDWHNLDLSGQGLRNLSPSLFAYEFLRELYIASNKLTRLPPAIGRLRQLTHLDASYNEITDLPPELGMCTYLRTLLLFNNRLRTLPFELGSLHMLEMIGIEGNVQLAPELRLEIVEKGTKSLITYLREGAPVPDPPPVRDMITIQEDVSSNLERFKVLTWNVLCDKYATPQTAPVSRCRLLCLQEISTEAFKEDFSPELAKYDYKGVQWPKTRAKTMSEKDALGVDGCAVFWKASKYVLLDKQVIEFASIAINRPDMKNQHDVFNRVMPRDNIAVICFFESRLTGARMVLVNVHLTWDSALADVKTIQTGILMEHVTKMAEKYARWPAVKDKKLLTFSASRATGDEAPEAPVLEPAPSQEYRNNTDIPLLVCGDFNSQEDSSISNYQYGSFTRDGIEHPFSLRDAYAHIKGTPDQLPFTNYTPGFADVIDYLWYSTNTLEVVELLGPPDADYLKRVPSFPNYHFPADHIQIMADFVIKARKDKKVLTEPDFGSGSNDRNR
ncbi:unnamed protein product [Parascedosporium putredinis]|uniref:CCR4-Not complex 3'-5'-exoribonuclease subunit Ccr4 n=1 Tax=Parascedosporium putredinis TaxID=1442378 RepID=A0A9P1GYW0_9PEZI|nr:unnamed protein product [Parascedosporium putredinis]CAI7991143.1 unnamed protein product [Parascedosporium putredinis]